MRLLLAGAVALLFAACATAPPPGTALSGVSVPACAAWFVYLDGAVRRAGVADAQEARVENHPQLRANRFIAALAQDPRVDDAAFARKALPMMRALDRAARAAEISNLPQSAIADLGMARAPALLRTEQCAAHLFDAARPDRAAIVVPDDYRDAQRLLGAYALMRYPFTAGVRRQLAEVQAAFARPLAAPPGGRVLRYAVTGVEPVDAATQRDAALLERHQPVFELEIAADADQPGALAWDPQRGAPVVQPDQPTVYRHVAFTRYRGSTLTQLVYTVWFGARPASTPGDLLAGHLDGLIWRVTLDNQGRALVYDTIHPCGCYHYFFPTPRASPIPAPSDEPEWAFAPQAIGDARVDERIVLRIATRTHYLERVTLEPSADAQRGASALRVLAQDRLRALPVLGAGTTGSETHSAYGPDGLIPGTERAERFLFWPMGIPSAGQMRQWGRHATAFVGRRHFDDAALFEKRFVLAVDEGVEPAPGPIAKPMRAPEPAAPH
jgi:hypothetical protein